MKCTLPICLKCKECHEGIMPAITSETCFEENCPQTNLDAHDDQREREVLRTIGKYIKRTDMDQRTEQAKRYRSDQTSKMGVEKITDGVKKIG